jgi:hypothetical protein
MNNTGEIGRKCRISILVIDNTQLGSLFGEPKHRFDEVVSVRTANPRRAQDDMARVCVSDTEFSGKLGASIHTGWPGGIGLHVSRLFVSVEYVVGGKMHNGRSGLCRGLGDGLRAGHVDRLG